MCAVRSSSTAMAYSTESTTTTESTTITEVTFEDVPKKPEGLRLKLQQDRRIWQRVTDWAHELSPENWKDYMSNHHSPIMASLDKNGKLSQEECDELNAKNEEYVDKKVDDIKQQVKKSCRITPDDTPEAVKFKMGVLGQLLNWLDDLFSWLVRKIQEIFSKIKESFQWCWQKAKELFSHLYSIFK